MSNSPSDPLGYDVATRVARRLFRTVTPETLEDIIQEGYAAYLSCGSPSLRALARKLIDAFRGMAFRTDGRTVPIERMARSETMAFNDWPVDADMTGNGYRFRPLAYDSSMVTTDNGQATVDVADLVASYLPDQVDRQVAIMKAQGYTLEAIAVTLRREKSAVASRWLRIQSRLREKWKPES